MNITKIIFEKNVDIRKPKLIGTASVIFDYGFAVHDVKLMTGAKGEYLVFPSDKAGKFITFPITNEMRLYMLDSISLAAKGSK